MELDCSVSEQAHPIGFQVDENPSSEFLVETSKSENSAVASSTMSRFGPGDFDLNEFTDLTCFGEVGPNLL